jgi:hypothetical protein
MGVSPVWHVPMLSKINTMPINKLSTDIPQGPSGNKAVLCLNSSGRRHLAEQSAGIGTFLGHVRGSVDHNPILDIGKKN